MSYAVDRMAGLAELSYGTAKGVEERRGSQEESLSILRGQLGAPGTYELPSDPSTSSAPSAPAAPAADGLLSRGNRTFVDQKNAKKWDKLIKKGYSEEEAGRLMSGKFDEALGGGLLKNVKNTASGIAGGGPKGSHIEVDPQNAADAAMKTSAGRQVSRMMAESEQLLARSGPLYDEMIRSTQLPIIEGSAVAARENTEALRTAMARGGSARRDAFDAITKIRAQDQVNMQRGQALADAHMKLDMWTRDNAKNVINFADSWSANQAGVRDSFHSAMDQAAELMSSQAIPMMYTSINKAQEIRDQQSAARRSKINNWIKGSVGLVVGAVGAFYGGSGAAMDSFGDMSGKGAVAAGNASSNPGLLQAGKDIYSAGKSAYGYLTGGNAEASTGSTAPSNNYMGSGGAPE